MINKCMVLICLCVFYSPVVTAGERNDVPSCYKMMKLDQFKPLPSGRMLTVLVDQTTPLDIDLQKKAWSHIKGFIRSGDKLRMYTFSAYLNGYYTKLEYFGELERPIPEDSLGNVPIAGVNKLKKCLDTQKKYIWKSYGQAFAQANDRADSSIPRSEILFSLKEIGKDLAKLEGVDDHVVFIMSDMLEHSEFGSFYSANSIRLLNPEAELEKVDQMSMWADFKGARFYVHGAAFVETDKKHGYRSGKMINRLSTFWQRYFERSNGALKAFGAPELSTAIE